MRAYLVLSFFPESLHIFPFFFYFVFYRFFFKFLYSCFKVKCLDIRIWIHSF